MLDRTGVSIYLPSLEGCRHSETRKEKNLVYLMQDGRSSPHFTFLALQFL